MSRERTASSTRNAPLRGIARAGLGVLACVYCMASGAAGNRNGKPDSSSHQRGASLEVSPQVLHLNGKGSRETVFVTATYAGGGRSDVTRLARFETGVTGVVRVEAKGALRAVRDGVADVPILFGGRRTFVRV